MLAGGQTNPLLWDIPGAAAQVTFAAAHLLTTSCLAVAPDAKTALTGGNDRLIVQWDIGSGKELHRYVGHLDPVLAVSFESDGQHALSVGADTSLWRWDLNGTAHRVIGQLDWDTLQPTCVTFAPNGKLLAMSGTTGRVILWETTKGSKVTEWSLSGTVHRLSFSADGKHLATANANGTVYVYRLNLPE
jgi:WD40 repeat protein